MRYTVFFFCIAITLVAQPVRPHNLGTARLEGPEQAEVYTYGTWTLAYTAGTAGIKPGGGIRIGLRHLHQWTPPQTTKPSTPGYLTVQAAQRIPVTVYVSSDWKRFFSRYFPWQNMTEVILPYEGLKSGETIRVTYGDRREGSPGIRVQPFDEARFVF